MPVNLDGVGLTGFFVVSTDRVVADRRRPAIFPKWENQRAMGEIPGFIVEDRLRLVGYQVLPPLQAAKGHARLSNRGATGKGI